LDRWGTVEAGVLQRMREGTAEMSRGICAMKGKKFKEWGRVIL
jgi:hypothetical protein